MKTTIKDILSSERLCDDLNLIAGQHGKDKTVSAITIMEVDDYNKFDLDNFFILTTFSFLRDNTDQINSLFQGLIEKGISGLAFKPGRFIKEIPQDVLKTANEHQVPLLLLKPTSRFHNIISEMSLLINENHLFETQNLNHRYEELYKGFIEGNNINFFVDTLSSLINKPVMCTDENFNILASSSNQFLKRVNNRLDNINLISLQDTQSDYYQELDLFIYPCTGYKGVVGYFMIETSETFNEIEMISIKQLATFITMRLSDRNLVDNFKRRERRNLIRNMLLYDSMSNQDIILRLQALGYSMGEYYQLLYFKIDSTYNHSLILQIISERLDTLLEKDEYLLEKLENGFVLIVNVDQDNLKDHSFYPSLLKRLLENLTVKPTFTIGYSLIRDHSTHFSEVFTSINNSIKFSKVLFPNDILVCTEQFTDYKILYRTRNTPVYTEFVNQYIAPLIQLDKKKDNVYWQTLRETMYCQTIQEAAEQLYIHKTTVKYRLDKIKDHIGLDFYNPIDKIKLMHVFIIYTIELLMK